MDLLFKEMCRFGDIQKLPDTFDQIRLLSKEKFYEGLDIAYKYNKIEFIIAIFEYEINLFDYITKKNLKFLELLLEKGELRNKMNGLLINACYNGNLKIVKLIIDNKLKLQLKLRLYDAIGIACHNGHDKILEKLLENNLHDNEDYNQHGDYEDDFYYYKNDYFFASLKEACFTGNIKIVNILLKCDFEKIINNFLLSDISKHGHLDIIKLVIKDLRFNNDNNDILQSILNSNNYGYYDISEFLMKYYSKTFLFNDLMFSRNRLFPDEIEKIIKESVEKSESIEESEEEGY